MVLSSLLNAHNSTLGVALNLCRFLRKKKVMLFAGLRAILLVVGEKASLNPLETENLFCKKQVKVKTPRKRKHYRENSTATSNKINQVIFLIT